MRRRSCCIANGVAIIAVTLLIGVSKAVHGEQGDGSVDDPIRERSKTNAELMFNAAGGQFQALVDKDGKPTEQEFIDSVAKDDDFKSSSNPCLSMIYFARRAAS